MNMKLKSTVMTLGLVLMGISSQSWAANGTAIAPANTAQPMQPTPAQIAAYEVCDFASVGLVELVGVAHQAGITKSVVNDTIAKQITHLNQLSENAADKQLINELNKYWRDNIDVIYAKPIQPTDNEKIAFLQAIYTQSMTKCIQSAQTKLNSQAK